jgi:hypothetical protein
LRRAQRIEKSEIDFVIPNLCSFMRQCLFFRRTRHRAHALRGLQRTLVYERTVSRRCFASENRPGRCSWGRSVFSGRRYFARPHHAGDSRRHQEQQYDSDNPLPQFHKRSFMNDSVSDSELYRVSGHFSKKRLISAMGVVPVVVRGIATRI